MRFIDTSKYLLTYVLILYSQKVTGSAINFEQQDLKILTSKDGSVKTANENDESAYTVTNYNGGVNHTFNSKAKCVGIKYKNQFVYQYNASHDGDHYPSSVFFDSQSHDITVHFDEDWYYNYSIHSDKYELDSSKKPLTQSECPSKIQLFNANSPTDAPTELEFDQYRVVDYFEAGRPRRLFYYFEQAKCGRIMCDGQLVWSHNSESEYPSSMTYMKEKIILEYDNGAQVFRKNGDQWELKSSKFNGKPEISNKNSLRGKSNDQQSNKDQKKRENDASFPDTLADALVLVIMVSIIASLLVLLILLLSIGLTFFIYKRVKKQTMDSPQLAYNYQQQAN